MPNNQEEGYLQPLRERAHIVCTECHTRKVKCDLQERPDGPCRNCRRSSSLCVRRDGARKKRKATKQAAPCRRMNNGISGFNSGHRGPRTLSNSEASRIRHSDGFISQNTVMAYGATHEHGPLSKPQFQLQGMRGSILEVTKADVLPRLVLRQALMDAYFKHIYPFCPIIDRSDVSESDVEGSLLVKQAVCLVGSLMQHDPNSMSLCCSQYEKVKTLIYLNYEPDNLAILKTFCLLICFSPLSTDQVTLDGPWHWLGMGVRLAIQMGLHKSATYVNHPASGSLRRIFWYLVNSDRMASSCWGRPSALRLSDCDIAPPSPSDFPVPEIKSVVFIQITRLTEITGDITEINLQQREMLPDESTRLSTRLCNWLQELPEELRLYDARGNRLAFYRPSYELHISYFATIILLEILNSSNGKWRPALSSLVAASCIARLYEEMYYREETAHFLHLHGFLCMVAAVPLISYRHDSGERETTQAEELEVIYCVLRHLRSRYGGSDLVLRKLMSLQQLEEADRRRSQVNKTPFNESGYDILDPSRRFPGQLADFFPFPASFCPGMDLLQSDDNSLQNSLFAVSSMSFDNAPDPLVENYFNLADMLLAGYETFDGCCAKEFEDQFDRQ